jgi:arabinofuranosyltransferase
MSNLISRYFPFLVFSLFSLAFINTAWVADDAYITFRVVDNALNGYGLTWNPGERVQVYTHPLWFFLLLAGSAIHNSPYYVSLILSYLCVVGALFFAWKILLSHRECGNASLILALLIICSLLFSKAFIDYMSSGLENPLGYLLVTVFLWIWFEKNESRHFLLGLTFVASAMYLNRPDSIVLIFPAFLYALLTNRTHWRKRIAIVLLGGVPVLAWVLFSLAYYGSTVPNTALAKLSTGISAMDYIIQSARYFQHTLNMDYMTILLLVAGCLVGFLQPSLRWRGLSSGLLAWCAYLFMVGSDYMAGRFFSVPVLFSAILCARAACAYPFREFCSAVLVIMLLSVPQLEYTLFSPVDYKGYRREFGIADERGFYYQGTGLLPVLKNNAHSVQHLWLYLGGKIKLQYGGNKKYYTHNIGMMPYAAGPGFLWIDGLALSDAFTARLPARPGSRVGHYSRSVPFGYLDSVVTGTNQIADPALARLYDDVLLATTGDIFHSERFAAILRLNTGFHKNAAANYNREAENSFHGNTLLWLLDGPPLRIVPIEIQLVEQPDHYEYELFQSEPIPLYPS